MRCPYCQTALLENSPECPNCKLTLNRANAILGPLPRFSQGLGGATSVLSTREIKQLGARISEMKRRFPQVTLHIIVRELPTEHSFDLYLFWIFNSAGLSEEAHKGGDNRDILLLVDPAQLRAGMIVGYGLEAFLREEALDHLLALAEPAFRERRWMDGFVCVVEGLDKLLESAAIDIENAMGVTTQQNTMLKKGEY